MLVESVPNVSEGRRLDVVDRLAEAVTAVPGVHLLDRTSDPSHNRSVFTLAGAHESVTAGLERLVAAAIDEIEMDRHEGEHPRIGAVDVIPFIPLGSTTMDECVALAHEFGQRIADRHDIPVYFYARAAAGRTGRSSPTSGAGSTRASRPRSPRTAASRTPVRPAPTRGSAPWPSGRGRS
jgi:glutamate formiminotransferase